MHPGHTPTHARVPQDIKMFINSPGGSVTAGMGIYDAMMMCRADVQTYCFGLAASMGAFLLGAGAPGKRYSMPNARIMIHQPLGGASGAAVDIEIQAKEIMYHKANLNRIMAQCTGQPIEKVGAGVGGSGRVGWAGGAGPRGCVGAGARSPFSEGSSPQRPLFALLSIHCSLAPHLFPPPAPVPAPLPPLPPGCLPAD